MSIRRPADAPDLSDLTDSERTGPAAWIECPEHGAADCLDMPMDPEPTTAEAVKIRRRLVTMDEPDEQRLHDLLALRPTSPFERMWLATELARYGESPG